MAVIFYFFLTKNMFPIKEKIHTVIKKKKTDMECNNCLRCSDCLKLAVRLGSIKDVERVLQNDVHPDIDQCYALRWAVSWDMPAIVTELLRHGASLRVCQDMRKRCESDLRKVFVATGCSPDYVDLIAPLGKFEWEKEVETYIQTLE